MSRGDPYRAFRFIVEIDAVQQGGFQNVTGIQRETKLEAYREGGENRFERQLAIGTTYPALMLKRGLIGTDLWDWHQDVVNGRIERHTVSVILLDPQANEAWRWVVAQAYPTKWTGSDLDAMGNTIATESVELVHLGITRQ